MGSEFELKPPKVRQSAPKRANLGRQSSGEPPEEAPITVSAWSTRGGDESSGHYSMVAILDDVPANVSHALIEADLGAGTYLLTDHAGRKSRWVVKPSQVAAMRGAPDEVEGELDERDDLERRIDEMRRLKELLAPDERQENPTPPAGVDWGRIIQAAIPIVTPLISALTKRLSGGVVPSAPPPVSPTPSAWADFGAWCESAGMTAAELRAQIEAAMSAAQGG